MVPCESCDKELNDQNLQELEDKKGKMHLVCNHCKKLSTVVLNAFGDLEWNAFILFVQRHNDFHNEISMDVKMKRE